MQGLSTCPAATAAVLSGAAQVAFAMGVRSQGGQSGRPAAGFQGGVGFHGVVQAGIMPEEVQQAMHWHEVREGLGHAATVR